MNNTQLSLKQIYNIVDWIDLGLVAAIIFYYARLFNRDTSSTGIDWQVIFQGTENTSLFGILLLLASLAVCITFIYLTVKMRKRQEVSAARATARIVWNAIWIPLDCYFLFMILFS